MHSFYELIIVHSGELNSSKSRSIYILFKRATMIGTIPKGGVQPALSELLSFLGNHFVRFFLDSSHLLFKVLGPFSLLQTKHISEIL